MQSQDGLVHYPDEEKHIVYFFFLGNPAKFVVEGDCYFGF